MAGPLRSGLADLAASRKTLPTWEIALHRQSVAQIELQNAGIRGIDQRILIEIDRLVVVPVLELAMPSFNCDGEANVGTAIKSEKLKIKNAADTFFNFEFLIVVIPPPHLRNGQNWPAAE